MMRNKLAAALALMLAMLIISFGALAEATTYEVSTGEQLAAAVTEIRTAGSGEFVISLQADFTTTAGLSFNMEGLNVTILGNGHTLTFSRGTRLNVDRKTVVNLGSPDGTDTLVLVGYDSYNDPGLIYDDGVGTVVNMYPGVTIRDAVGNNNYGGAVTVRSATFHMYGGTIQNCGMQGSSTCFGGAVGVTWGGQFIMDGGVIKDCFAKTDYCGSYAWQIPYCAGGGVFLCSASFVMNGGSIENCSVGGLTQTNPGCIGGGVAVLTSTKASSNYGGLGWMDSTFVMNGGTITGCHSEAVGGGVGAGIAYVSSPFIGPSTASPAPNPNEFGIYINAGSITKNEAASGGGIFMNRIRREVSINNLVLTDNIAEEGAGVMIFGDYTNATFKNCTITGNKATAGGGGGVMLYSVTNSDGTVIEDSVICNNLADEAASDVYVSNAKLKLCDAPEAIYLGKPDEMTGGVIDGWYEDYSDLRYVDQTIDQHKKYEKMDEDADGKFYLVEVGADEEVCLIAAPNSAFCDVTVNKVWSDDEDSMRSSYTVQLYADGEPYDEVGGTGLVTLAADVLTYTWEELPGSAEYTVKEVGVPAGYVPSYALTDENVWTITNTRNEVLRVVVTNSHEPERINIDVSKIWEDDDNTERPEAITVRLYANGVETGTAVLKEDNNWHYTFEDLYKYDSGAEIVYSVTEDTVTGYTATITGSTESGSFTVTNTLTSKVDIMGDKIWDDDNDRDGKRPESITLNIKNGDEIVATITVSAPEDPDADPNTWSWSVSDLPKYDKNGDVIDYTVEEVPVEDYETTIEPADANK